MIALICYDYSRQLKNSQAAKKIDPYAEVYFGDEPLDDHWKRVFPGILGRIKYYLIFISIVFPMKLSCFGNLQQLLAIYIDNSLP